MSRPERPKPTSEWLDEIKAMDVESLIIELTLLDDDEFARAMCEKLYGPIPPDEV